MLRTLAEAHSDLHPDVTYAYKREEFVDMHLKDWVREEYTMGESAVLLATLRRSVFSGALASFGPVSTLLSLAWCCCTQSRQAFLDGQRWLESNSKPVEEPHPFLPVLP